MIQGFKIIHGIDNINLNLFFNFADNSGTRGHNLRLQKPTFRRSLRQNSFSVPTVSVWNNLPQDLVRSKSVLAFKSQLDKLWSDKRFDVSEVY